MITTIKDLFEVSYGQKEFENKSLLEGEEGENIVVSSKGDDNGVYGFFNTQNGYKAPVISVPRTGTIGQAFVQLIDCSIDNNCLVLVPKKELTIEQLFQIAFQIRLNKWRYKYGRQITPAKIEAQEIILENLKVNFDKRVKELTPKENQKQKIQENKNVEIMKVKDLCEIEYGERQFHNKEWLFDQEGENILISSKGIDNGVYGFYDIQNKYNENVITVQGYGTIGEAFVQLFPCSVDDHLLILIPKKKLSVEELYQVAFQVRLNKWAYKYGRGITPTRLGEQEIRLEKLKVNFDKMVKDLTPKEKPKQKIQENKNIRIMRVKDLCEIKKKTAIPQNAMNLNGNVPYVTTSSMNNGVSQFADEEPNFEGKCLSVAMNGSVGEVFFQIDDFITSGDNAVLTIKEGYNPYLLLFIGTLIRNHRWRYNYYRKMSLDKLKNLELPIPMKNGKIDLEYIEKIVKNAYGFEEVKQYL